jgi:hypothetical protein
VRVVAGDDGADVILLEVQGEPDHPVALDILELEHLLVHDVL